MMKKPEKVARLRNLSVLRLQPGDILILQEPNHIPASAAAAIKEQMKAHFPGHRCLVLSGGMQIAAMRLPDKDKEFLESQKFEVEA